MQFLIRLKNLILLLILRFKNNWTSHAFCFILRNVALGVKSCMYQTYCDVYTHC
jgi:hypothetical protein